MIFLSRRLTVLHVLLAISLLAAGIISIVTWHGLPYGYWVLALSPVFLLLSILPMRSLLRLRRLQKTLETPSPNDLDPWQLPSRPGFTYLADAFPWIPLHVERLSELALSGTNMPEETTERIQGNWHLHGIGADSRRDLFLPNRTFQQHVLILGTTGTGKSRQIEVLVHQAIARGETVVIIDPKPDERLMDRAYDSAVRSGREADWRLFALPHPQHSVQYNPVANYTRPSEVPDRISLVLPRGSGDAEAFRNFAWDFVHTVTAALHVLDEKITIIKLQRFCLIEANQQELVRRLIKHLCPELPDTSSYEDAVVAYQNHSAELSTDGSSELDALIAMAARDRDYFDKLSSALRPLFAKLTSQGIGNLLNPNEALAPLDVPPGTLSTEISWQSIHNDASVVYMNLGSMMGPDTAQGVARMILADLQSYIGTMYAYDSAEELSKRPITVIIDELKDTLYPNAINLLNKARGAGVSLVLAGQSLADLESALESRVEARRALANLGTILCYRLASGEDVDYMSRLCGTRPIRTRTESHSYEPALLGSGNTFIDDFSFKYSRSFATKPDALVPDSVVNQLPTGHAIIKTGGLVYKAFAPLLTEPQIRISPTLKNKSDMDPIDHAHPKTGEKDRESSPTKGAA